MYFSRKERRHRSSAAASSALHPASFRLLGGVVEGLRSGRRTPHRRRDDAGKSGVDTTAGVTIRMSRGPPAAGYHARRPHREHVSDGANDTPFKCNDTEESGGPAQHSQHTLPLLHVRAPASLQPQTHGAARVSHARDTWR
jgi:hypothetical protein